MIGDKETEKAGWVERHPNDDKMPAGIDPDTHVEVRQETGTVSDIPRKAIDCDWMRYGEPYDIVAWRTPDSTQSKEKSAPLEKEIREMCNSIADMLVEKNASYGNSAAEPLNIFSPKGLTALDKIGIRIDDKLSRQMRGSDYTGDDNDLDLAGYLILRLILKKLENQNEN